MKEINKNLSRQQVFSVTKKEVDLSLEEQHHFVTISIKQQA